MKVKSYIAVELQFHWQYQWQSVSAATFFTLLYIHGSLPSVPNSICTKLDQNVAQLSFFCCETPSPYPALGRFAWTPPPSIFIHSLK